MDKCYFKIVYRPDQLNCLRYRNNCVQRCMYSFSLCWFLPLLFCYYPHKTDLARSPFSSLYIISSYIILNIYFDTRKCISQLFRVTDKMNIKFYYYTRFLCAAHWYFYVKYNFFLFDIEFASITENTCNKIELSVTHSLATYYECATTAYICQKTQYFPWQFGFLKHRTMSAS